MIGLHVTRLRLALAAAGLIALAAASPALAASAESTEQSALNGAKISLSQAISIAEQQSGGKAFDAGADVHQGRTEITVETNGPNGVRSVVIDAQNGQVLGTHGGGEAD